MLTPYFLFRHTNVGIFFICFISRQPEAQTDRPGLPPQRRRPAPRLPERTQERPQPRPTSSDLPPLPFITPFPPTEFVTKKSLPLPKKVHRHRKKPTFNKKPFGPKDGPPEEFELPDFSSGLSSAVPNRKLSTELATGLPQPPQGIADGLPSFSEPPARPPPAANLGFGAGPPLGGGPQLGGDLPSFSNRPTTADLSRPPPAYVAVPASAPSGPGRFSEPPPSRFSDGPPRFDDEATRFNSGGPPPPPTRFNDDSVGFNDGSGRFNNNGGGPQRFNGNNDKPRFNNNRPQRFNNGPPRFNNGPNRGPQRFNQVGPPRLNNGPNGPLRIIKGNPRFNNGGPGRPGGLLPGRRIPGGGGGPLGPNRAGLNGPVRVNEGGPPLLPGRHIGSLPRRNVPRKSHT